MALTRSFIKGTLQFPYHSVLPCSIFNVKVRHNTQNDKLDKRWSDVVPFYQSPDIELSDYPKPHYTSSGQYKPDIEKLKKGLWPWNKGIRSRLPDFFKDHYLERFCLTPTPVHYHPNPKKYKIDSNNVKTKIPEVPIPIIFPKESDEGLWGGEGIVMGWRKRQNKFMKPKSLRVWKPLLVRRVFYSEILDQYLAITVTLRTLDLVDDLCGFDNYILKTRIVDLHSKLGMRLKRAMLQTLIDKSMYQDDKEKQDYIYEKYKEFLIPREHIEWLGLTLPEAEMKQKLLEEEEEQKSITPLKYIFAENLLSELHKEELEKQEKEEKEKSKGLFAKLNPFKDD